MWAGSRARARSSKSTRVTLGVRSAVRGDCGAEAAVERAPADRSGHSRPLRLWLRRTRTPVLLGFGDRPTGNQGRRPPPVKQIAGGAVPRFVVLGASAVVRELD